MIPQAKNKDHRNMLVVHREGDGWIVMCLGCEDEHLVIVDEDPFMAMKPGLVMHMNEPFEGCFEEMPE